MKSTGESPTGPVIGLSSTRSLDGAESTGTDNIPAATEGTSPSLSSSRSTEATCLANSSPESALAPLKLPVNSVASQKHSAQDPTSPTTPTNLLPSKILARVARKLGADWKFVCRELGLEECDIEEIENDNKGNVREQAYQGLKKWRQSKGKLATLDVLIAACKEINKLDAVKCLEDNTEEN